MAKMTKGQSVELIEQVKVLIIKAHTDYAIVKTIMAKYGLQNRQARSYLYKAHEQIIKDTKLDVEHERKKAISRYNYLIERCISKEQFKSAALIQEKLDKITGAAKEIVENVHTGELVVRGGVSVTWHETKTFEQSPSEKE